jgi:hypothetical protein
MDLFSVAQPKDCSLFAEWITTAIQSDRKLEYGPIRELRAAIRGEVSIFAFAIDARHAINRICGSARGTIDSRTYWLPDAIHFGETP